MLSLAGVPVYAVDFNTDVLDAADRQNIDFPSSPGPAILCPDSIRWKSGLMTEDISPSAFQIAFLEPPFRIRITRNRYQNPA